MLAPCQTCAKMRAAFAATWQRAIGHHCVVQGCRASYPICRHHWNALPLKLKQRWWQETDYSGRPPNDALVADVNRAAQSAARV